jgi:hypothetical protein
MLLAGFSSYTAAVAERELQQTLEEARPAERNLLVSGPRTAFGKEMEGLLGERLSGIVADWLVIRHAISPADPHPVSEEAGRRQAVALLDLYSFSDLAGNVHLVEGRLPDQVRLREAVDTWRPPPIEVVIGAQAAEESGYGPGDRLSGSGTYHRLDIVGIVEPLEPEGDLWGEDLSAFAPATKNGASITEPITLPLILAPASMRSHYPEQPIFPHELSWRVTLRHPHISVDRAEALRSDLINFQTQSATLGATTNTGLVRILGVTLARLSRVRMLFLLLTAQTLLFVLYTLTMFTSFVVDRARTELATQAGRGASAWQITRAYALENLALALPAAFLGPVLALLAIHLWTRGSGEFLPGTLPGEAWLLSAIVVGLGWLALILPVYLAARRYVRGGRHLHARPPLLSLVQKHYLDLYLLIFGALLLWQLNRAGSFVARALAGRGLGDGQLADPLLLLGPTLLLVALTMVCLRIWPPLLRLAARLSQRLRGLVLPLSLLRLARNPLPASRLVLLVSLSAGLVLFARTFQDSLAPGPAGMASSDALGQGVSSSLQLNALTLVLFSAAAFFLVNLVAVQDRVRSPAGVGAQETAGESGVLRTMGVSLRQSLALLGVEGSLVALLGLLAGTVVGLGLSYTMIPYLSQALAGSLAGVAAEQITVDWSAIARLYSLLVAVYGAALAVLLGVLGVRGDGGRRTEDE